MMYFNKYYKHRYECVTLLNVSGVRPMLRAPESECTNGYPTAYI